MIAYLLVPLLLASPPVPADHPLAVAKQWAEAQGDAHALALIAAATHDRVAFAAALGSVPNNARLDLARLALREGWPDQAERLIVAPKTGVDPIVPRIVAWYTKEEAPEAAFEFVRRIRVNAYSRQTLESQIYRDAVGLDGWLAALSGESTNGGPNAAQLSAVRDEIVKQPTEQRVKHLTVFRRLTLGLPPAEQARVIRPVTKALIKQGALLAAMDWILSGPPETQAEPLIKLTGMLRVRRPDDPEDPVNSAFIAAVEGLPDPDRAKAREAIGKVFVRQQRPLMAGRFGATVPPAKQRTGAPVKQRGAGVPDSGRASAGIGEVAGLIEQADALHQAGRSAKARATLRKAEKALAKSKAGGRQALQREIARGYAELGDFPDALERLAKTSAPRADELSEFIELARAQGRADRVVAIARAAALEPAFDDPYAGEGECEEPPDTTEADDVIEAAVDLAMEHGRWKSAEVALNLMGSDDRRSSSLLVLVQELIDNKAYEQAVALARRLPKVITKSPCSDEPPIYPRHEALVDVAFNAADLGAKDQVLAAIRGLQFTGADAEVGIITERLTEAAIRGGWLVELRKAIREWPAPVQVEADQAVFTTLLAAGHHLPAIKIALALPRGRTVSVAKLGAALWESNTAPSEAVLRALKTAR